MKDSIVQASKISNVQRRELARAEMGKYPGLGKFMYLLHSPYVRKALLPDGLMGHSAIDAINVLSDSDNDPRIYWANTKTRLIKDDKDMFEKIKHISFPLWNDKSGRSRAGDALTNSGLVILVFELHTPTSNEVRHGIANIFDRYKSEYHADIIAELERTTGWAGTMNRLAMQSIYEEGDYDNPRQPPGTPK